jgi:hypothetical protein
MYPVLMNTLHKLDCLTASNERCMNPVPRTGKRSQQVAVQFLVMQSLRGNTLVMSGLDNFEAML